MDRGSNALFSGALFGVNIEIVYENLAAHDRPSRFGRQIKTDKRMVGKPLDLVVKNEGRR